MIENEIVEFTALPTGWRCVSALWFEDGVTPFHIIELPAVGVALVSERLQKDIHDRGVVIGTHLDFVVVTGDGLETWDEFVGGINTAQIGFLEPGQKLEAVYSKDCIDKAVESARKKSERYRNRLKSM